MHQYLTCYISPLLGKELENLHIWKGFWLKLKLQSLQDQFCLFCPWQMYKYNTHFRGKNTHSPPALQLRCDQPSVEPLQPNPFQIKKVFFQSVPKSLPKPSFLTFTMATFMFSAQRERRFKGILEEELLRTSSTIKTVIPCHGVTLRKPVTIISTCFFQSVLKPESTASVLLPISHFHSNQ